MIFKEYLNESLEKLKESKLKPEILLTFIQFAILTQQKLSLMHTAMTNVPENNFSVHKNSFVLSPFVILRDKISQTTLLKGNPFYERIEIV